jgi:hypothetical protein
MQRREIGTGFNDEIGVTHHRIEHKLVGFDSVFYGNFNGIVSSNLATENFIYYSSCSIYCD